MITHDADSLNEYVSKMRNYWSEFVLKQKLFTKVDVEIVEPFSQDIYKNVSVSAIEMTFHIGDWKHGLKCQLAGSLSLDDYRLDHPKIVSLIEKRYRDDKRGVK